MWVYMAHRTLACRDGAGEVGWWASGLRSPVSGERSHVRGIWRGGAATLRRSGGAQQCISAALTTVDTMIFDAHVLSLAVSLSLSLSFVIALSILEARVRSHLSRPTFVCAIDELNH